MQYSGMGTSSNKSQVPFLPMSCRRRTITASIGVSTAKQYAIAIQKTANTQPLPKKKPSVARSYVTSLDVFNDKNWNITPV